MFTQQINRIFQTVYSRGTRSATQPRNHPALISRRFSPSPYRRSPLRVRRVDVTSPNEQRPALKTPLERPKAVGEVPVAEPNVTTLRRGRRRGGGGASGEELLRRAPHVVQRQETTRLLGRTPSKPTWKLTIQPSTDHSDHAVALDYHKRRRGLGAPRNILLPLDQTHTFKNATQTEHKAETQPKDDTLQQKSTQRPTSSAGQSHPQLAKTHVAANNFGLRDVARRFAQRSH